MLIDDQTKTTQVFELQAVVSPGPAQCAPSEVLLGAAVPQGQQGGQPGTLAGQTAEPGLLPRPGAYRAGAGVAGGQSRLQRPEAAGVTRSLIDASD